MNSLGKSIIRFWNSSIGKKLLVGVTGIVLVLFLMGHLAGNLLTFQGRHAMNDYAEFLHTMLHGSGIWIARVVLITVFVLHILATIALTRENRAAKPEKYQCDATVAASRSSRIMIWSGLVVLAFVLFHILHFTVRVSPALANLPDPSNPGRHDVWGMVIKGFQNPLVVGFYVIALTLLCSHLSHGIASIFQTLGLSTRQTRSAIEKFSQVLAIIIWLGFISIPLSIAFGYGRAGIQASVTKPPVVTVDPEKVKQHP